MGLIANPRRFSKNQLGKIKIQKYNFNLYYIFRPDNFRQKHQKPQESEEVGGTPQRARDEASRLGEAQIRR